MEKNQKYNSSIVYFIIITSLILLTFYFLYSYNLNKNNQILGGDKDENGCIISAGFSYNYTENECVKEFLPIEDLERYQVKSFQDCINAGYQIMESYPRQCKTPSGRIFKEVIFEDEQPKSCNKHSDCELPIMYAIRSNCPFSSYCINNLCGAGCPQYFADPNPNISKSYASFCLNDLECTCRNYLADDLKECKCIDNNCVAVVA